LAERRQPPVTPDKGHWIRHAMPVSQRARISTAYQLKQATEDGTGAGPASVQPRRASASPSSLPTHKPRQIDAQGQPVAPTPAGPLPATYSHGDNQPRCIRCGEELPDNWRFQNCYSCLQANDSQGPVR
jgi:hypothetical protein